MARLATIVLAAGKGTRMKSSVPKVLHEVCGKALIDHVLTAAQDAGSLKTCVVLGHERARVQKVLSADVIAVEQKQLLGTGDAVKTAAKALRGFKGDLLILCGDTPLLKASTLRELVARHRQTRAAATILTAVVDEPRGYGRIIRDNTGKAVAIREDRDCDERQREIREINTGVFCFQSEILFSVLKNLRPSDLKGEYYLTDVISLLVSRKGIVETLTTDRPEEGWGVNTREDLARCAEVMRGRIISEMMLSGVTVIDPKSTCIDCGVQIGPDTVIKPFTVIEKDVVIGKNCTIGPFAHLRPGTRIDETVEIGNFAEVSRSVVGRGTFMKHFSFLGDAIVGREVNIGAGTITANFDGKDKHATVIGDGAFIGSDSVLVAPVKIGKKSRTGAGSVVTRGKIVPDGKTVVGVPARIVRSSH